jgi:hypothetical protein
VIVSGETPNPKPQTPGGIGDSLVNLKYAGKSRPSPILDWFIKADWDMIRLHIFITHLNLIFQRNMLVFYHIAIYNVKITIRLYKKEGS